MLPRKRFQSINVNMLSENYIFCWEIIRSNPNSSCQTQKVEFYHKGQTYIKVEIIIIMFLVDKRLVIFDLVVRALNSNFQ